MPKKDYTYESKDVAVKKCTVPSNLMITPRSFQADRIIAKSDIVITPETNFTEKSIAVKLCDTDSACKTNHYKNSMFARFNKEQTVVMENVILFDCRFNSPNNWAQFQLYHLISFYFCIDSMLLKPSDVKLVLPKNINKNVLELLDLLGQEYLITNATIQAKFLTFDKSKILDLVPIRRQLIEKYALNSLMKADEKPNFLINEKIFISRRKTRALINEQEVSECLKNLGYKTIYAEDYSAREQHLIIRNAKSIVAIHGAALGPLAYTPLNCCLEHVIELMPVGHTVYPFRDTCYFNGIYWIGVRGKMKESYIKHIYNIKKPFLKYSLDSFAIDTQSLEQALSFANSKAKVSIS
jgi:capsular polysaccharide biosynthesis protein